MTSDTKHQYIKSVVSKKIFTVKLLVLTDGLGEGESVKAKTTKTVVLHQTFHLKALFQKRKVGGGKKYTFSESPLEDLFKN